MFLAVKKTFRFALVASLALSALSLNAQTNIYDDVIATSPDHTYLQAALDQQSISAALQAHSANLTVFAPTDDAFDDLAALLNTDIAGLLALPNLTEILNYHVLGQTTLSTGISNGDLVTPLNTDNTLKMTVTSGGSVFANQAEVNGADLVADNGVVHSIDAVLLPDETVADVAIDNGFTTLTTAVIAAELLPALTDPFATLTVFAPTNDAFDDLVDELGIDIPSLLALPELADILTYHVLTDEVESSMIANGDVVDALSTTNTLKLSVMASGDVFVNQAEVTSADLGSGNGIVHQLDAVLLPSETVVDVAIDNGFSTLATAVITAELLPALSAPFATYTVFAPTNDAFDDLVDELGIDIPSLLALPELADILTYHVLTDEVEASMISNGDVVNALSSTNTLKLTVTSTGEVFVNQAEVTMPDVSADNGVVHIIDAAVMPSETVVDVALDNGFTTLATALITADLLPALSDPFAEFTVFAPENAAFDALAADLNTDLAGILALPNLADILLYHVVEGTVLSSMLSNGDVPTLNGAPVTIDVTNGVMVNASTVTTPDVTAENGVVHVVNGVLVPEPNSIAELNRAQITLFPNPTTEFLTIGNAGNTPYQIVDVTGAVVLQGVTSGNTAVEVSSLESGTYFIRLSNNELATARFVKQ